jgi:hypothetical protein
MAPNSCVAGACVPDPSFRVTGLTAMACTTVNDQPQAGTERGGVVVSLTSAFHTGSTATVRFAASDLTGAVSVGATPVDDALLADLQSGNVYVLEDATGTQPAGTFLSGTVVVTQLHQLDATTGMPTSTIITLSSPIRVAQGTGLFSGYGRIVVQSGGTIPATWYQIRMPSGAVTTLRMAASPPHTTCPNWAYWGIAEFFGGDQYVDYVSSTTTISRFRVRDGMTSSLATFTNLAQTCGITFSPARNRWYFHTNGLSQFSTTFGQFMSFCGGTFDQP